MSICPPCKVGGMMLQSGLVPREVVDAEHQKCPELARQSDPALGDLERKASAACDCMHKSDRSYVQEPYRQEVVVQPKVVELPEGD